MQTESGTEVLPLSEIAGALSDGLAWLVICDLDGCPQACLALYDLIQARFESIWLKSPAQPIQLRHVEDGIARLQLVQEPKSLLRKGEPACHLCIVVLVHIRMLNIQQ